MFERGWRYYMFCWCHKCSFPKSSDTVLYRISGRRKSPKTGWYSRLIMDCGNLMLETGSPNLIFIKSWEKHIQAVSRQPGYIMQRSKQTQYYWFILKSQIFYNRSKAFTHNKLHSCGIRCLFLFPAFFLIFSFLFYRSLYIYIFLCAFFEMKLFTQIQSVWSWPIFSSIFRVRSLIVHWSYQ